MPNYYLWDYDGERWDLVSRVRYSNVMRKAERRGAAARGFIKDNDNELGVQEPVQETSKRKFTCHIKAGKLGCLSWLEVEDLELGVIVYSTSFIYTDEWSFGHARRRVDEWCEQHGGRIV